VLPVNEEHDQTTEGLVKKYDFRLRFRECRKEIELLQNELKGIEFQTEGAEKLKE